MSGLSHFGTAAGLFGGVIGTPPSGLSGLTGDFREDRVITDVDTDPDGVFRWPNLGSGPNLIQNTGSRKPQKGDGFIRGDGVTDIMTGGTALDYWASSGFSGANRIAYNDPTNGRFWLSDHSSAFIVRFRAGINVTFNLSGSFFITAAAAHPAAFFILLYRYGGPGTAIEIKIDGNAWETSAGTTTITLSTTTLHLFGLSATSAEVDISHHITYNQDHTQSELEGLGDWIAGQV